MRKIIINYEIPKKIKNKFLEVKDLQYSVINKPMFINMIDGKLNNKEILMFLKNTNNPNILLISKRKPNKNICMYFDKDIKYLEKSDKLGFVDIFKIYKKNISYDEKLELFRRTGVAPHIILKTIVSSTNDIKLIKRLVEVDQYGFPTLEILTASLYENGEKND